MEEKLERIEKIERKIRKFERKGYKLMAELKTVQAYEQSLAPKYAEEAFARTIEWSDSTIRTAREWTLKGK